LKPKRASARFRAYRQVARALSARHPLAFPCRGIRPPLKVGVLRDISKDLPEGVSRTRVRLFLSMWTASTAYLIGVSKGRPRVCLEGLPAGEVDASHVAEAAARLAERRARAAERRATKSTTA
jgi:sRNA-binding protein